MFAISRMVSPNHGTGLIWPLLILSSTSLVLADQFDRLTPRVSGTRRDLRAVAFGEGRFVALGAGGMILTSTNSADWSIQPSGITNHLTGVVYGNARFVAV